MLKKIIDLLQTAAHQTRAFILALLVLFRVLSRSAVAMRRYPKLSAMFFLLAGLYATHYIWTMTMPEALIRRYYHQLNLSNYLEAYRCWEGHEAWTYSDWSADYYLFVTQFYPTQKTDVDSISVENQSNGILGWLVPNEIRVTTLITFVDEFWPDYLKDKENITDALCAKLYSPNEFQFVIADQTGTARQRIKRAAKINYDLIRSGIHWRIHDSTRVYIGIYGS